jgi:hypothetical protein
MLSTRWRVVLQISRVHLEIKSPKLTTSEPTVNVSRALQEMGSKNRLCAGKEEEGGGAPGTGSTSCQEDVSLFQIYRPHAPSSINNEMAPKTVLAFNSCGKHLPVCAPVPIRGGPPRGGG